MSYDELYEAWEKEKKKGIQPLPKAFYAKLSRYVNDIMGERRMLDEATTRAQIIIRENENVNRIITDLVHTRYKKILKSVLMREPVPLESLTTEEEAIHDGIVSIVETSNRMLKDILSGRVPQAGKINNEPKKILIRFLQAIPTIVGSDMKIYGPFKAEDVAFLPAKNAQILIKNSMATRIETS